MAYKKIEPDWVCHDCATRRGARVPEGHCYTVHTGKCGICREVKTVTEPRDYGSTRHLLRVLPEEVRLRLNAYARERYAAGLVKKRYTPKPLAPRSYREIREHSARERRRIKNLKKHG